MHQKRNSSHLTAHDLKSHSIFKERKVNSVYAINAFMPSVLWHCWLGGRKGIQLTKKTERWGAGMVICLEQGADLHMAQLMPLPLTVATTNKRMKVTRDRLLLSPVNGVNWRTSSCLYTCKVGIYGTIDGQWSLTGLTPCSSLLAHDIN